MSLLDGWAVPPPPSATIYAPPSPPPQVSIQYKTIGFLEKIVSGGQTGSDQAGIRAARRVGLRTGGFVPKGWMTQDGAAPWLTDFGLVEYTEDGYKARTYANVRESDATVRIARDFQSPGEICTLYAIEKYKKPYFDVALDRVGEEDVVWGLVRFLVEHKVRVLNVAGNSERTAPGISRIAEAFLVRVLENKELSQLKEAESIVWAPPVYIPTSDFIPMGVDSETYKIVGGRLAPRLVCVSNAKRQGDQIESELQLREEGVPFYQRVLKEKYLLVIHNAPFDLAVAANEDLSLVPFLFDAFREGRICCTIVLQKLIDIALGQRKFRHPTEGYFLKQVAKSSYGLDDLIQLYYNEYVEKEDTWRISYALLDGMPLERWPQEAKQYARYDAVLHLRLWEAQNKLIHDRFGGNLPNQREQQMANWALHLMGMWGVRAEREAVKRFIEHCEREVKKMQTELAETGIFRPAWKCRGKCLHEAPIFWTECPKCQRTGTCVPNPQAGTRSMAEIRRRVIASCNRRGVQVPMTDPSERFKDGQVQTDKEALEQTDDPALHVLASQMTFAKHLGQWGPVCEAAIDRPVCARYESLRETGRTACSGDREQKSSNFQNPPRRGDVRPCFIPRKHWLFGFNDADTIELRAQAQNCLEIVGWSKMAEALWDQYKNKGPDLHVRLAANILGISLSEAHARRLDGDKEVGDARQFAKIPGFGLWGGLGPETLITYAAAQLDREVHRKWFGVTEREQLAKATWIREVWLNTWPEARLYFRYVSSLIPKEGLGVMKQQMSGRIRGGVHYTSCANSFFQGRVADAMKEILFHLADECYTGRCVTKHVHGGSNLCTIEGRSRLEGSRPCMFLHDESVLEHPEDGTESDRAERQRQVMNEGLARWLPDVPSTSAAVLTRRWYKGAEPLFVDGKLVPVKPEKIVGADGKEKTKWIHDIGDETGVSLLMPEQFESEAYVEVAA